MGLALFDESIIGKAREVGGEFTEFDRQTSDSESARIYTVVGKNSKDGSYRGVLGGKSVEVSRAGEFRCKNPQGELDYFEKLADFAILDARTAYVIFRENRVVARGISTNGLQQAVWTNSEGLVRVGDSCEASPFYRWSWEKLGGPEGRCRDDRGEVIMKEDLATCSLQLFCWDVPKDEHCIVQFSSGALKHYREFARSVEAQGVKMHSILWCLTTSQIDNGASAAPSYVPEPIPTRVLTPDEFAKADEKRASLVVKASALAPARLPKANSLRELQESDRKALPSAFSSVPLINVGPSEADPSDVFAGSEV